MSSADYLLKSGSKSPFLYGVKIPVKTDFSIRSLIGVAGLTESDRSTSELRTDRVQVKKDGPENDYILVCPAIYPITGPECEMKDISL